MEAGEAREDTGVGLEKEQNLDGGAAVQEESSSRGGEQSLRGSNVYVGLGYTGLVLCGGVLPPAYSRSLLNGWKDGQRVSMNCSKTRSHIIRGHYEIYSLKR